MRKQQQIWQQEHEQEATLPGIGLKQEPSSFVRLFVEYLKKKNVNQGKAIDIGCGKGRNAIYLAREGYEVYAIDYIESAVHDLKRLTKEAHLENKISAYTEAMDQPWSFEDNFFDIAVDCFSSIDVETKKGREIYKKELFRTLKSGGYAMVSAVSVNDEVEAELMRNHPGEEKNSVYWPANGKYQKNYDEEELREFYKEFTILELREIKRPNSIKLGKTYTATNLWAVLQKP